MMSPGSLSASTGSTSRRSPTFFIDRSLGPQFAEALRRFEVPVIHMRDEYPYDGDRLADEHWLPEVTAKGWIVLTGDQRMIRRPHERAVIFEVGAKVFSLHQNQLRESAKGMYIGRYLLNIRRRGLKPGPCFWRLSPRAVIYDVS